MLHKCHFISIQSIKILLFFVILCMLFGCSSNQNANNQALYLGKLQHLKIMSTPINAKPKKEIARICTSFTLFNASKQYEILTFENLLKVAREETKQSVFTEVGIWQQSWNFIIWQKKCLILGV